MTNADKFKQVFGLYATELWSMPEQDFLEWLNSGALNRSEIPNSSDTIYRRDAIDSVVVWTVEDRPDIEMPTDLVGRINALLPAQPEQTKYEYHYDHTDCIWYRPEARNRCPTTCAQYRDGWNDAMNYIFRDGKGYRPYRRDKQYGE